MTIRDIARETKTLSNNSDAHIQVTKTGRSYMTYKVYGNDYFKDGAGETTIGFINYSFIEFCFLLRLFSLANRMPTNAAVTARPTNTQRR